MDLDRLDHILLHGRHLRSFHSQPILCAHCLAIDRFDQYRYVIFLDFLFTFFETFLQKTLCSSIFRRVRKFIVVGFRPRPSNHGRSSNVHRSLRRFHCAFYLLFFTWTLRKVGSGQSMCPDSAAEKTTKAPIRVTERRLAHAGVRLLNCALHFSSHFHPGQ